MWTQEVDATRRREHQVVARVALGVLVAMVLVASLTRAPDRVRAFLLAYQVAFEELDLVSQSLCREARVAVDEMCVMHEELQDWPTVQRLEEEGIPPFAPLLLVGQTVTYGWQSQDRPGGRVYLGRPADGPAPALLVRLEESAYQQDPAHGALARADAHHVRLPDGTVVHASLWVHDDPTVAECPDRPEMGGWRQVVPGDLVRAP